MDMFIERMRNCGVGISFRRLNYTTVSYAEAELRLWNRIVHIAVRTKGR